jgi:aspartate/glutamate racemase
MREAPRTMQRIGLLGGMSWESSVPVFDTTRLHAHRAVDLALRSEPA